MENLKQYTPYEIEVQETTIARLYRVINTETGEYADETDIWEWMNPKIAFSRMCELNTEATMQALQPDNPETDDK